MKAVNLLPRQAPGRKRRRIDSLVVSGSVVTLAVAAVVAGGFVLEHRHAQTEQQQLVSARSALARLKAQQSASSSASAPLAAPTVLSQQESWRAAIATVLISRVPMDRTLAQLADVIPGDVTLTTLSLGSAGSSAISPPGSSSLTLTGRAASHTALATLLARLKLVPGIAQIALGATSADATGAVTFQVQAQVSA